MKILILSWKDITHPQKGGAEVLIWNYAKELHNQGNEVTWVGSSYKGALTSEEIDGVHIIRFATINTIYFKLIPYYFQNLAGKYDIIIDEAGGPPMLSPLYIKDTPIVFFIHHISDLEWDYKFKFPLNVILKYIYRYLIRMYKKQTTITVSDSTREELIDDFSFIPENVYTIENALDIIHTKEPNISQKENTILFFGRIMPLKRVEHAILAFNEFSKSISGYTLKIVGPKQDEEYFASLVQLVKDLELETRVSFEGGISLEERHTLKSNKIMLVPSYKEGFGLVVLEANIYGIPALGYQVGGIRDSIKDGINGYKVMDGDYKKLGNTLVNILSNNDEYESLMLKSYHHVISRKDFSQNTNALKDILEMKLSSPRE